MDRNIRGWAAAGLAGSFLAGLGSFLQAPGHVDGPSWWQQGVRASATLEPFTTFVGGTLGVLGALVAATGTFSVFWALRTAGRPVAWVAAGGLAVWWFEYGAWHGIRPMVAHLVRVAELAPDAQDYTMALTYLNVHRSFGGVGLFAGSVFFFFTVLFRTTLLPRWAAAAAPVLWVMGIRLTALLPEGTAGPVGCMYLDLLFVPLYGVALLGLRSEESVFGPGVGTLGRRSSQQVE